MTTHASLRLASHLLLFPFEATSLLSSLLPAARAAAAARRARDRSCRDSSSHRSRIRLQTVIDGRRFHLIYDRLDHVFVTAFPADPAYAGKPPPEIHSIF